MYAVLVYHLRGKNYNLLLLHLYNYNGAYNYVHIYMVLPYNSDLNSYDVFVYIHYYIHIYSHVNIV